jgi:hypothetical protein
MRDEHGDHVEVTLTEEQGRAFMAGHALAYWSSTPEEIASTPTLTGSTSVTMRAGTRRDESERDTAGPV